MFELTSKDKNEKSEKNSKREMQKNVPVYKPVRDSSTHDVRYQSVLPLLVIQYMRPEDFQNGEDRNITIITKENLRRPDRIPLARPIILANGLFQQDKSSRVSELVSIAGGENYFQLGWDNCILLHKNEERYQVAESWRMEGETAHEKRPEEAAVAQGVGGWMPADQPIDSLITWSVSSCEVVILVSADRSDIAIMHINNDIPLPADVLDGIAWESAFVSIIDDVDEIRRTNQLLDALHPTNIRILNRKYASDNNEDHELRYDTAGHGLNYIGLDLSGGQEPQIFGSQGKDIADLEGDFAKIMRSADWKKAKDVLMNYYTLRKDLEVILLCMPHVKQNRAEAIEEGFQNLKQKSRDYKEYYDIFKQVFMGTSEEQFFKMNLLEVEREMH